MFNTTSTSRYTALSTQHSALSTQHSALSTQHSALSLRRLISGSSLSLRFILREIQLKLSHGLKLLFISVLAVCLTACATCKNATPNLPKWSFDNSAQTYSPVNAYALAEAAYLAYEDKDNPVDGNVFACEQAVEKWHFEKCVRIQNGKAVLLIRPDLIILAFRGTNSWEDGKTDINFPPVDFGGADTNWFDHFSGSKEYGGKVHQGFLKYWEQIAEETQVRLNSEKNGQPVWVTGHSLGGALAVLAVASLNFEEHKFSGLYTFGQPRVGDKLFSTMFNERFANQTFRLVHNNDPVPGLPFQQMNYCHVGRCLYIDSKGELQQCSFKFSLGEIIGGGVNGISEGKFALGEIFGGGHVDMLYATSLTKSMNRNPLGDTHWDFQTCQELN